MVVVSCFLPETLLNKPNINVLSYRSRSINIKIDDAIMYYKHQLLTFIFNM